MEKSTYEKGSAIASADDYRSVFGWYILDLDYKATE